MPVTLDTVLQCLKFYLNEEDKLSLQEEIEAALLNKLNHCTTKSMELLILQTLFLVISDKNLSKAIEWLKNERIDLSEGKSI
jgi:myo-inositol catabolism protein IolC